MKKAFKHIALTAFTLISSANIQATQLQDAMGTQGVMLGFKTIEPVSFSTARDGNFSLQIRNLIEIDGDRSLVDLLIKKEAKGMHLSRDEALLDLSDVEATIAGISKMADVSSSEVFDKDLNSLWYIASDVVAFQFSELTRDSREYQIDLTKADGRPLKIRFSEQEFSSFQDKLKALVKKMSKLEDN